MAEPRRSRAQPARRSAASAGNRSATARPAAKKSAGRKPAARKPASRKPAAKKPASRKAPAPRARRRTPSPTARRLRAATGGDRPYLAALVVLVVVVATMALGPLQNYTAAADRLEELTSTRDQLAEQVDQLEDRREQLSDPEELELIARSELGLVKPGEVPFVVVSPDGDGREQVRPEPVRPEPAEDGPWYRRLGRSLADLFSTG